MALEACDVDVDVLGKLDPDHVARTVGAQRAPLVTDREDGFLVTHDPLPHEKADRELQIAPRRAHRDRERHVAAFAFRTPEEAQLEWLFHRERVDRRRAYRAFDPENRDASD